tara:strand:+ start:193 stop:321 length:129 start_codon:yes stop_codon:yes gene_type:complete
MKEHNIKIHLENKIIRLDITVKEIEGIISALTDTLEQLRMKE